MKRNNDLVFPKNRYFWVQDGLTKREYFAAIAMQGLLANGKIGLEHVSNAAIKHADTVLEELKRSENNEK